MHSLNLGKKFKDVYEVLKIFTRSDQVERNNMKILMDSENIETIPLGSRYSNLERMKKDYDPGITPELIFFNMKPICSK